MSYKTVPFLSKILVDWERLSWASFSGVGRSRPYQIKKIKTKKISPKNAKKIYFVILFAKKIFEDLKCLLRDLPTKSGIVFKV